MDQSNSDLVKDSLVAGGFPKKTFLRKTGEEIEIVSYYQNDFGVRSLTDYISYIDSAGQEHFKEKLSYSFDIKEESTLQKTFESLMTAQAIATDMKVPSPWALRKMEILKALIISRSPIRSVIDEMNEVVDKLKEDPDFKY